MSLNINFFFNLTGKTSDNIFFTNKEVRSLPGVLRFLAGIIVGFAESLSGLDESLTGLDESLVGLDIILRELTESRESADNIFSCYYKSSRAPPRKCKVKNKAKNFTVFRFGVWIIGSGNYFYYEIKNNEGVTF